MDALAAYYAILKVGLALMSRGSGNNPINAFVHAYGTLTSPLSFEKVLSGTCGKNTLDEGGCTQGANHIQFAALLPNYGSGDAFDFNIRNIIHELFHAFDKANGLKASSDIGKTDYVGNRGSILLAN